MFSGTILDYIGYQICQEMKKNAINKAFLEGATHEEGLQKVYDLGWQHHIHDVELKEKLTACIPTN